MKTSISIFLIMLIISYACFTQVDKNSNEFTLKGEINGQDSGKIYLRYILNNAFVLDTVRIINGKFIFTGKIFEPTSAELNGGNDLNLVQIYLEPKKMRISLSKDKFEDCKMSGSITQNEFQNINQIQKPFMQKTLRLRQQLFVLKDSLKNTITDVSKPPLLKRMEDIEKHYARMQEELDSIQLKFVLENPKSFLSSSFLKPLGSRGVISFDSLKSIYNKLDKAVINSRDGKLLSEYIRKNENTRIGNLAPDFKAIDIINKVITLSSFKGKHVVLLDFWASWCVPCRESLPNLKRIYKRYNPKGFDIIAISIDQNRKAWTDAVRRDSTDMWHHILIAEKWPAGPFTNDDIFQNYYYKGVPEQILIDQNGKIIDIYLGQTKDNSEYLDRLLFKIYEPAIVFRTFN
jgi:thiol-disulfide isomerase/thioredoxin